MIDVLKRLVLLLGFVTIALIGAGCDDADDSSDCSLESVLDDAETPGTLDCGSLTLGDSDAAFQAVSDCVSSAALSKAPFRAIWEIEGIDSELREAYLGHLDAGVFEIVAYHWDSDVTGVGDAEPQAFGTRCLSFTAADEPCDSLREDLCFVCAPGEVADQCP